MELLIISTVFFALLPILNISFIIIIIIRLLLRLLETPSTYIYIQELNNNKRRNKRKDEWWGTGRFKSPLFFLSAPRARQGRRRIVLSQGRVHHTFTFLLFQAPTHTHSHLLAYPEWRQRIFITGKYSQFQKSLNFPSIPPAHQSHSIRNRILLLLSVYSLYSISSKDHSRIERKDGRHRHPLPCQLTIYDANVGSYNL